MRLKEYARNPEKRKAYVQQPGLLLVGVAVSKAKHRACIGTPTNVSCRKLEFTHTREGVTLFEQALRDHLGKNSCHRLLIAMEPSGISWQGLYERLRSGGDDVCLVSCQAVRNNRKTMHETTSKTDETDAYSVLDVLRQGTCFLPVERDAALKAADRLIRRYMALNKRVSQLCNHVRAAIHLTFPELHPMIKDLTQPTSLRFLQANPTPESVLRNGRQRFLETWQPRRRCGQWRPEKFHTLYDMAKPSIGLKDPYRTDEFEIKALAHDLADALGTQHMWLTQASELLEPRQDFQLLLQLPRIGKPTAAAILTAIGDVREYKNGTQLVKLAGLDIRLFESGSSVRKLPKISHVGSAYLRHGLSHFAMRLVAHDPHFKAYSQRRKRQSPGKGAGQRALVAVCDKTIRMLYRILTDQVPSNPNQDQNSAHYYAAQRKAA